MMKIDIDSVIRSKAGKKARFIPRFVTSFLAGIIRQRQLNEMLEYNRGKTGADFCRGVVEHLGVTTSVHGAANLPPLSSRPMFVSNHPLGGLDGMILIDTVTRHYGVPVKFIVNDLLMAVEPLRDVFLPVNHHGSQNKDYAAEIDAAFRADNPILIFPAGLVSRKHDNGEIHDLKWHKMFVKKALQYNRTVIPTHFIGLNSTFFYNFAYLRRKSGIKINLDMIWLPAEVFRSKGKHYDIVFGKPLEKSSLESRPAAETAEAVAHLVQTMNP